jgi:hypothetical protein
LGILANRREQELARLVKQLREAEEELAAIREKQAGLQKKMKEAAELPDPQERKRQLERLSRQQKELEQQAGRLARRLKRLQAEQASQSAASAAGKMAGASQAGEQGQSGDAQQNAEQAQKDLEDAQQQLAERRRQAEEDLAREQVARMEDSLKALHEEQKRLIQETERLENLRAANGRLTRAQLSTVNDLARQQEALRGETTRLAEKLSLAEVINLALDGAAKHMARAAELLEHRETGAQAQGAQEAARLRLAQLLAAFEKDKKSPQGAGQAGGSGGGAAGRGDGDFVLTQLKLLKLLQEDLSGRYRSAATTTEGDADTLRRQMAELAEEQGKLAELTLKLSAPPDGEKPEDDPEKLPDVRLDDAAPSETPLDVPPPGEPLEPATKVPGFSLLAQQPTSDEQTPAAEKSNRKPLDDALLDDLDNELLEGLGDLKKRPDKKPPDDKSAEPPLEQPEGEDIGMPSAEEDPLGYISQEMRQAEQLIPERDKRAQAEQLHERIVEDLAKLIQQAEQRRAQQQASNNRRQQQSRRQSVQQPKASPGDPGQTSDNPASDSTNRLGRAEQARPDPELFKGLLKETWGNLPERDREQMLQSSRERFLPQYELLIERYYRRLAEERTK